MIAAPPRCRRRIRAAPANRQGHGKGNRPGEEAGPCRNGLRFGGWLGDRHFLATMPGRTTKIVMLDLRGEIVRVLADGPATELEKVVLWYTAR
ncbi:hypothetical protein GCM10009525_38030 [Streptosporangium amethystogenes subsp. fukuiense]